MTMVWSPDYLGSPGKMVLSNPLTCTNTPKGDNKLYSDAKGVVPSLDLRFAEGKNLNDYVSATPLVDHQRSMSGANLSPGTFVNSSGLIETTKVNLLARSQEFNESNWVKAAGGVAAVPSVTANAEIAPDGTLTADRVVFSLNGGTSLSDISDLRQTVVTGTGTYTVSFYIRSFDGTSSYSFLLRDGDGLVSLFNVTGSWQRIEVSSPNYLAGSKFIGFVLRGGTGTSSSADILVWGAQLEEGTTASTYIPTTNVQSAAPRFDHDPTTGESLGLLIEESRTNLVTYSEQFDNAAWFPTSSGTFVVTPNASLAPDGTTTADLVVGNNASTWITSNGGAVSAGDYTFSVWLKSDTPQTADILMSYGVTDTLSCSVTTDWQRFTLTATRAATVGLFVGVNVGNAKNIYIWGAQIEEGSFPTSYIPTSGTALTRSADVASITGSNFSSWYNESEGTIYGIFDSVREGASRRGWSFGGGGDRHWFYAPISQLIGSSGGSTNYAFTFPAITSTAQKAALGYALNNNAGTINGSTIQSDTSCNPPIGLNSVGIGSDGSGTAGTLLGGTIARLTYFPERLPDSSLQTMTTP